MSSRVEDERVIKFSSILRGLVCSFAILVVFSIILGFFFSMFNALNEEVISRILLVINYVAIFIGGLNSARASYRKGWLTGGFVGLLYMLIILVLGLRWVEVSLSLDLILRIISGFIAGAIGGIIGINLKKY